MDIIDHIKQLDEEHGNKLRNLCINSNNYEAILEIYFNDIREIGRPKFEISDKYHDRLVNFLYHTSIDFDQYVIYLVNFLNTLQPYNLQPDNDGNYHLNNRLRMSKTLNKNTFTYYSESSSQNIKITFIITQLPPNNDLYFQISSTIIKLDNLTITAKKHPEKIYLNKVFSTIAPYFLFTILILTIVFAAFTENIISITNHLFRINLYSKIATLIFIICGFILGSQIYKIMESLREYSRIVLSFKINKKYSNTEKYLRSFDDEKKQKVPLFENRERPINTPNEDFLGFNLLCAALFYNSIETSFDPNINLITIIDAKRGMGKTSFINLLIQRINGFTYRHDADCQLFKDILTNKQIKIVQFSIMPFLAGLNSNNEKEYINNFITFIAQNLTPSSSKYLKAILSSTTAFNDKFNLEKFISQIANNDDIAKLKNNLKLSEQKNLIIIEDLDRLNEEQLKIFAKSLWFIHDLPFTITLLPAEEEKIKKAVNLPIDTGNNYEELEEYKLFQFSFSLKDYFYKLLANYATKHFDDIIKKWQINSEIIQLKQLNNHETEINNIYNDWVSHLYKNNLVINNAYISMRLNNKIINSINNELVSIFEKYNISIREFKAIFVLIHIGGDHLFIVQQILFYMIAYRYKYHKGIIKYLNKYDTWGDFKKNHHLNINIYQERFLKNRLDGFSSEAKEMILNLERFPLLNIHDGIMAYINSLFGFINRSNRQNSIRLNLDKSANVFYSEFITVFFKNTIHKQDLYDDLSANWHNQYYQLSIIRGNADTLLNCKDEFIISFNERAETTISANTKGHEFSYNLFLYQNFAILLLLIIHDNKNNTLTTLENYFNGDKLYNQSIRIYNEFYDTMVSFDIDVMIDYFRRLFNINHNNFEYDNTYQTLQNNYKELQDKLILEDTDPKFREVFTKIFKMNITIKN